MDVIQRGRRELEKGKSGCDTEGRRELERGKSGCDTEGGESWEEVRVDVMLRGEERVGKR